jgi:Zn-dependent peptidase ImmA (M78 family)
MTKYNNINKLIDDIADLYINLIKCDYITDYEIYKVISKIFDYDVEIEQIKQTIKNRITCGQVFYKRKIIILNEDSQKKHTYVFFHEIFHIIFHENLNHEKRVKNNELYEYEVDFYTNTLIDKINKKICEYKEIASIPSYSTLRRYEIYEYVNINSINIDFINLIRFKYRKLKNRFRLSYHLNKYSIEFYQYKTKVETNRNVYKLTRISDNENNFFVNIRFYKFNRFKNYDLVKTFKFDIF